VGFTDTIVRSFAKASADIQNIGRAIGDVFTIGFSAANKKLGENVKGDYARIDAELKAREATILSELDGNSRQQDAADEKAKAAARAKTVDKPPVDETAILNSLRRQQQQDAIANAEAAALQRHLQDELAIYKSFEKQREQAEKTSFDQGKISADEYFARRKADLQSETDQELAILNAQLKAAQDAAARSAAEGATNTAKAKQFGPDTQAGKAYSAAAAKDDQEHIANLTKIDELQTKITTTTIDGQTKAQALDDEQFKQKNEINLKLLEFEKEIDSTADKRRAVAQAEIEIEKQKLTVILQQSGATQAQVQAELARFTAAKTAQVNFTEEQKSGADQLKELADQRAAIEEKVASGQLFQVQGQQQIREIEQARLPVLQQIAAELLAQAQATGDEDKIAAAEDFQKQVTQIQVQSNQVGQQIATIKQGIQSSLTGGIEQFFNSLVTGTRSVGDAFKGLAASVIDSIAKMTAQMLSQIIVAKLLQAALGGAGVGGGGGGDSPLGIAKAFGFAEGGLIRGPGGPKDDKVPALLSHGEYVVKADAVSQIGVGNLEAINRGLKIPAIENLSLPKFAEGGLVGGSGGLGDSNINLGIGLDEGLILRHLSSKAAGNIIIQHLANNPKAAGKALSRSQ
jgi:hypothetical protein